MSIKIRSRRCRYCRKSFTPGRVQEKDADFCCEEHRLDFHKYGTLVYRTLIDKLAAEMLRQAQDEGFRKALKEAQSERRREIEEAIKQFLDRRVAELKGEKGEDEHGSRIQG